MKPRYSLATGFLACLALSASVATMTAAQAQNNPYSHWKVKTQAPRKTAPAGRAYVPARGSSTRQGIADAMRRDVGKFAGVYVIFTFTHIKASGDWAYAEANPTSPNGKSNYEPVSALLKRSGTGWHVVDRVAGEDGTKPFVRLRQLKLRNPKAPRDIFPR